MELKDTYPGRDLEVIAESYLNRNPAHIVDSMVLTYDMQKLFPMVVGPLVLEMGYGDGVWTPEIIRRFGKAYIVDGSSKLLERAREVHGHGRLTTFHCLFEDFRPPEGLLFNTIVATHVLEHLDDPRGVLCTARSWLAPGGRLLIVVPNATSLHRQLAVLMDIQQTVYDFSPTDCELGHKRVYDLLTLRRDVTEAGYRIVMERGLFLKLLPNSMMTGFSHALLKALVDISERLPPDLMANIAILAEPEGVGPGRPVPDSMPSSTNPQI